MATLVVGLAIFFGLSMFVELKFLCPVSSVSHGPVLLPLLAGLDMLATFAARSDITPWRIRQLRLLLVASDPHRK